MNFPKISESSPNSPVHWSITQEDIILLLENNDVFDPEYYSKHYLGKKAEPAFAAAHFLKFGAFDSRNPSQNFNSSEYLERYPDVREKKLVAAIHYIRHGRAEGRIAGTVPDTEGYSPINLEPAEIPPNAKIAIIIHAFYDDYNAVFADLLSTYKFKFTLFVTAATKEIVSDLIERLKEKNLQCEVNFVLAKNRGRNFGPFLVNFGKELAQFDVIGHVHTKKSLYTGKARYDWGLHNITAVLGSPEYVQFVLGKLLTGEKYGIVCAEKHETLPFWAYHWLKNFDIANELAKKLKLDIKRGFLNYPIGGMFWARTDAIKEILNYPWCYEDFPEELKQTDGTTQHAIERLIGVTCESAGFSILKWSTDKGHFNDILNPGARAYESLSKSRVVSYIQDADVISFDIFDTLLYRNVPDPDDVRLKMDSKLKNYAEKRKLAEQRIRNRLSQGQDVRIQDVAVELADIAKVSIPRAFSLLSDEFILDLESMRARRPVANLVSLARSLGKRVIYVSDMYYGKNEIEHILQALGVPLPDHLYVSSAVGHRKDGGAMWHHLGLQESGAILHFGDNMVSDVQNAADHRINSVFVPTILDKAQMIGIIKNRPSKEAWPIIFPLIESIGAEPFFC